MKRSFSPVEDQLLTIADPVAQNLGFEIVQLRLFGGPRPQLQIMAQRSADGQMSVEDCARFSREVSVHLDVHDLIDENYVLEISSPGIDRPLVSPRDFARFEGFQVKIELEYAVEERRRFKGEIVQAHDDHVDIALEGENAEQVAEFPFDQIYKAKLVMSDDLMRKTAQKKQEPNHLESAVETQTE